MLEEPEVRVRHSQDLEWLYRSRAPLLLGMRIAGTFLFGGDEKHRTGKVRARLVSHREASHFPPEGTILVFQVQPAGDAGVEVAQQPPLQPTNQSVERAAGHHAAAILPRGLAKAV